MAEPQYPQTKIPLPVAKPRGIKPSQYRTTPTELEELFQQSLPAAVADIPVEEAMQALPPEEEPKPVTFVPTPDPREVAEARAVGIAKRAAERKAIAKTIKGVPGALLGTTVSILESVGEMVDPTPSLDQRKLAHRLKKSRKAKARKKALEGKDFTIAKALPEKLVAYDEKDIIEPEREKKMIQAYRLGISGDVARLADEGFNRGFKDAEKETAKRLKEMHWVERTLGDLGDVILAIPQLALTATTTKDPVKTGEDLATGMAGGTAHIFRHPLDSFESRPFMTLLTWIPALRALGAGGAATSAGKSSFAALAQLKRRSGQVMVDGAKKVGIRGTPEAYARFKRFWSDGMYQRTDVATRFVEDLLKAPDEAATKVRAKIEEFHKDVASGEFATAEKIASETAMAEGARPLASLDPRTETTAITLKVEGGRTRAETKIDAIKEPIKTPIENQRYEIYDKPTTKLIREIEKGVMEIRGLSPKYMSEAEAITAVKTAVRSSLAAVIYDHSAAFLYKGSKLRNKIIDNMIKHTLGLEELPRLEKRKVRKEIEKVFDNPLLTRSVVSGERISSGIIPEISFRSKVIFDQTKLQQAIQSEIKLKFFNNRNRKGFINRVKAEAVMRVGEDIANQAKKGTHRNLIETELFKTKPDTAVSNLKVLEKRAAKETVEVETRQAQHDRLIRTGRFGVPKGIITEKQLAASLKLSEGQLARAKQKLNEAQRVVEETRTKGTPDQQRISSTAEKFMDEAIIGEGDGVPHAPLMIEAKPAEIANHLKSIKETWLKTNKDAIITEGAIRDLSARESLIDASINFDDVVGRLEQYKLLPETIGKHRSIYADTGVHTTLVWEQRARATLEGGFFGKGLLGWVDEAMIQMKANLTVRNLPTHMNNFTANLALQMLRRGDPIIVAKQMATLKKWFKLRDPKKRRDNLNLTDAERIDMARFDAIVQTNLIDTDMVTHELGGSLSGKPLQKAYKWGDQIFKLEEAISIMKKADEAFSKMETGDWIRLVTTPRQTKTLWKLDGGGMSKTKDGVAISPAELNILTAKAGGHSALKLFFDYSDVSTMVKFLKTSRVLSLASPFYTWFWKAMTTGGKGLIGEVISGPTIFKTNSKAVNLSQFKEMGGVSLRRAMIMQGFLGELRNNEDKASRQKLYKYLPREVASHIVSELQDPTYSEGISVRGMNYASPQMIVLRGIGSAIVKGGAMFGDYKEEELYPKLPDGSTDFELKSVPPVQREDILKRRRLWGMHYRNELMTYDQALELAGLTGGLAVDLLAYVKDGEKDKRKHVDLASMWTQYGKILVGGVSHSLITGATSAIDPTNPWSSRRYGLKPQDPALTEDFSRWAMGQALTSLLKKRKVNTPQAVHKMIREGKSAMKLNLVKRSKDKIKNLRQLLKKAYGDGDDAKADEIEKYIEQVAITMGRTNSIINHQAVEVKKRFIDSLTVFK